MTREDVIERFTRPIVSHAHDRIGDAFEPINKAFPQCAPELGGMPVFMMVITKTCTIPNELRTDTLLGAPCYPYYMGMLAHELVHIEHCLAIKPRERFTVSELMQTEVTATQVDADVQRVLYQQQMREQKCTPTSVNLTFRDLPAALDFLKRADDYDLKADAHAPK